ncbi:MAG: zf-HC2 domain-containing protein [Candidatus Eisenbacteria bacterium]|nr:zf-HC2 domain-containing protein [Candidatus Eisenbacteria bacterium]
MTDRWTNLLTDHLDGDLSAAESRALEQHLESCADCRLVLAQLRQVKQAARALADPPVPDDLWAGIASRIGPAGSASGRSAESGRVTRLPARRPATAWTWAMAAGIALLLVSAVTLVHFLRTPADGSAPSLAAADSATAGPARLATFDADAVEGEIADLQTALEKGRGKLDPKTIAVLEKNLTLIRQATEDARRALAADPANQDLRNYFASNVHRKLELMRRATSLAGV